MRDRARRGPAVILAVLAASIVLGGLPVLATAPQPVIPVEGPSGPRVFDPIEQEALCGGGSAQASTGGLEGTVTRGPELSAADVPRSTATRGLPPGPVPVETGQWMTYPRPVLPVPPGEDGGDDPDGRDGEDGGDEGDGGDEDGSAGPSAPICNTRLSLGLVISSPDDRRPEGANAFLDDRVVPQAVLESGFRTDLEARDHRATLPDPRGDWKLVATSCGCLGPPTAATSVGMRLLSGPIRPGQQLSYPGPVVPVEVGGSCSSLVGSSPANRAGLPLTASPIGLGELATYPGPVIPVPPEESDELEEPPPPRPATVSWNDVGTVTISDPDGVGGVFDCVWTVEEDLLIPREGPWRATNRRGLVDCGPRLRQRIPPGPTETGRIFVRDEGRRLVMEASRGDSLDFVVHRDRDDPRHYSGSAHLPVRGMGRIDFMISLDLATAERMDGVLTATARIQGRRCDVRRPFRLRYAGGG